MDLHWVYKGYITGIVVTDENAPNWIGATAPTSYAAELTAEYYAAEVALRLPSTTPLTVRYDAQAAAMVSMATAHPGHHPRLAAACATQWVAVRTRRHTTWQHLRGHSDEPYNELVDTLCWHAARNPTLHTKHTPTAAKWPGDPIAAIRLAYITMLPKHLQDAYQPIVANTLQQRMADEDHWRARKSCRKLTWTLE